MNNIFIKSFYIAGFSYYQGAYVFSNLTIGSRIKLVLDKKNSHDENAVSLKFNGNKIGYIPRDENKEIAILLKAGYKIFEAVIQQISPEDHPERQVLVGLFVVRNNKKQNSNVT